jgi:lantibiotic modifying enzyme
MRLTASTESRPDVRRDAALAAERTELGRLDVPYFEHPIAGRDLLLGETDVAPNFFGESGLDASRRRIGSLGEEDILAQLALIDGSIAAKARRAHRAQRRDPSKRDLALAAPSAAERLAAAATVRDLLIEASISDAAGHVEWLGIDSATDLERSCYGPIGPTLYSGAAGIALFLAAAGRAGSDERAALCRQLARAACLDFMRLLDSLDRSSERASWWCDQPLGLAGSGGRLLSALLLRDEVPEMRRALDAGLEGLIDALDPEILRADEDLDIIFGCAGLIGPLLRSATPKAIALAETAGDRLVERQDREGGWVVPAAGAKALTGFSYGASGAAAALARLAAATGRDAYREAAQRLAPPPRWPGSRRLQGVTPIARRLYERCGTSARNTIRVKGTGLTTGRASRASC